jgi:hypothetical protein
MMRGGSRGVFAALVAVVCVQQLLLFRFWAGKRGSESSLLRRYTRAQGRLTSSAMLEVVDARHLAAKKRRPLPVRIRLEQFAPVDADGTASLPRKSARAVVDFGENANKSEVRGGEARGILPYRSSTVRPLLAATNVTRTLRLGSEGKDCWSTCKQQGGTCAPLDNLDSQLQLRSGSLSRSHIRELIRPPLFYTFGDDLPALRTMLGESPIGGKLQLAVQQSPTSFFKCGGGYQNSRRVCPCSADVEPDPPLPTDTHPSVASQLAAQHPSVGFAGAFRVPADKDYAEYREIASWTPHTKVSQSAVVVLSVHRSDCSSSSRGSSPTDSPCCSTSADGVSVWWCVVVVFAKKGRHKINLGSGGNMSFSSALVEVVDTHNFAGSFDCAGPGLRLASTGPVENIFTITILDQEGKLRLGNDQFLTVKLTAQLKRQREEMREEARARAETGPRRLQEKESTRELDTESKRVRKRDREREGKGARARERANEGERKGGREGEREIEGRRERAKKKEGGRERAGSAPSSSQIPGSSDSPLPSETVSLAADVHDLGNGSYQVSYALPHLPVAGGAYDIQVAYLGVPMAQTSGNGAGTQRRARRASKSLSSSTCVNLRVHVDTPGVIRQGSSEQGTEESGAEGECAVEVASRRQRGYWVGGEWRPFCVWPRFTAEVGCCCMFLLPAISDAHCRPLTYSCLLAVTPPLLAFSPLSFPASVLRILPCHIRQPGGASRKRLSFSREIRTCASSSSRCMSCSTSRQRKSIGCPTRST